MNDNELDKVFGAARKARPDTARVEYGFETRLLARIRAERERATPWFVFAWRLMPAFAAVVVAIGVWSYNVQAGVEAELGAGGETALAGLYTGE